MRLITKKSKNTYESKTNGKKYHYINRYIELDNGVLLAVKMVDVDDIKVFDAVSTHVE